MQAFPMLANAISYMIYSQMHIHKQTLVQTFTLQDLTATTVHKGFFMQRITVRQSY
jgi:hypothetical protein